MMASQGLRGVATASSLSLPRWYVQYLRATAYAGSAFVWHSSCWCTTLRCAFALEVGAHKWIACAHPLARGVPALTCAQC